MVRRGPAAILLVLVLFLAAGCLGASTDSDDGGGDTKKGEPPDVDWPTIRDSGDDVPAPTFPPRTDDQGDPVLLVHGFAPDFIDPINAKSEPEGWDRTRLTLLQAGWTGPILSYGYYGCDNGFDRDMSSYGPHEGWPADAHYSGECRTSMHTLDTPIEHLAQHFAWAVYDEWGQYWQCVDAVGHSMGGLILRYALHGVEEQLDGFPPRICVEDAVTMGTPHAGANFFADLCASLTGWTQCEQMTDHSGFIQTLQTEALRPQGSAQTDWTVMGSTNDEMVTAKSAVSLDTQQALYFLDGPVKHADSLGYRELSPDDHGYTIRFRQSGGQDVVASAAPSPQGWLLPALEFATLSVSGGDPVSEPQANRLAPTQASIAIPPGVSIEFEASCTNEHRDLELGEWWWRSGSGAWIPHDYDHVQYSTSPWEKALGLQFDDEGTFGVRFVCVNRHVATDEVEWTIEVDSEHDDIPTASRTSPSEAAVLIEQDSARFDGSCANPYSDLARAEWHRSDGSGWIFLDEDSVQYHDDPWTTSWTVDFPGEGSYDVRLTCIDRAGQSSSTTWHVTVQLPDGPTAYRYAPASSSISINSGDSVEFSVGCSNPDQELDRGEWWVKTPDEDWYLDETDTVQWHADPWEKAKTYTFSGSGEFGIGFRCVNGDGSKGDVEWSVSVT